MFADTLKITGNLKIERFTDGVLQEERNIKNLVVQSGKVFIAERMLTATNDVMSHMAVGTDTVAPVSTDLSLNAELSRVALASSNSVDNVVTYIANYPVGVATGPLTEAGIFNAATGGTMLARTTFAVVNKGDNDSISITWNITVQ